MPKSNLPWDQVLANFIIKHLVKTSVTPNQVTALSLIFSISGAVSFTFSTSFSADIGASLFVLGRFLDHVDGELARQKNMVSKLGYYLDYGVGGLSYGALFLCLGVSFQNGYLGLWSISIGLIGALLSVGCVFLNLQVDQAKEEINPDAGDSVGETPPTSCAL